MGVLLLEGEHIVCLGKQTAGSVQVLRRGLYYRILCRCQLPGDVVCRLVARLGEREEYIGIPVPEGDVFLLEKMIPIKRFGEEKPVFLLVPRGESTEGRFVPISPEEPFRYLERLKDSYLAERNGRIGVMMPQE